MNLRPTCTAVDCPRAIVARGLCHTHYERRRLGRHMGPILDTPEKRFWAKVDQASDCWLWTAATDGDGRYGAFYFEGKLWRAHRFAWVLAGNVLPGIGHDVDHLCRTTLCVRPAHLEVVTHKENVLRGESVQARNARKTHCLRGHEFTPENTYLQRRGGRACRACVHVRRIERLAADSEFDLAVAS